MTDTTEASEPTGSPAPATPPVVEVTHDEPKTTTEDGEPNAETESQVSTAAAEPAEQMTPSLAGSESKPEIRSVGDFSTDLRHNSLDWLVKALESIASSKEARRNKALADSVQHALKDLRERPTPSPEVLFDPLRLATATTNAQVVVTGLSSIGRLISYSYFSAHEVINEGEPPLIERAIDAINEAFQGEGTPPEVQLQILKSLLSAILNDKVIVHGAGLLKAVRQAYTIFISSRVGSNQQVAQATLTQMVSVVFERVKSRLEAKQLRMSTRLGSEKAVDTPVLESGTEYEPSVADTTELSEEVPGNPETLQPASTEKITLQSFENRKSFDDDRIDDNAPTKVTHISSKRKPVHRADSIATQATTVDSALEEEEDDVHIKDAFLVFRAMCKLSIKTLPPDQLLDIKSQGMRSKLLSLHLIHTIISGNPVVFTSPLVTIRSSNNNEPTGFVHAIKQYLCLSLSRNGASSVNRVFEVSCEIFWLMLRDMRGMLKREIEVFMKEIYLNILEKRNAPTPQKQYLLTVLSRLCSDPRALVEIYLNYDCDRNALENIFQRTIEQISRISSTPVVVTPAQQQYLENHQKVHQPERPGSLFLPPSLSTANIKNSQEVESNVPVEYNLKRDALECLVETLRSLVSWSQQGIADITGKPINGDLSVPDSADNTRATSPRLPVASPGPGTDNGVSTPDLETDDDPNQLEKAKQQKTALLDGIKLFNFKPKRGIKLLLKNGFIKSDSPSDVAFFLLNEPALDKAQIGEYLGEHEPQNVATMHAFVDHMDFTKLRFVDALRRFLQSFRLPGEAQKIDRYMLKFAERYMTGNPNAFANADTAYVLAYSVILLNTDQHSAKMKGPRMTKEDFIKNNRGINDNADLPSDYLIGIYDEIQSNEIVLDSEQDAAATIAMNSQGRELKREAYMLASEEMANKTEQLFRSLVRSQKRSTNASKFIPATSFRHVGPMFDFTWMSFLSGISGNIQDAQDPTTARLCMEGLKLAIRISCLFDLDTPRTAFVSALSKLTNLNNLSEMKPRSVEALKALLDIAQTEGNSLKGCWRDVLMCISQLERFQLISTGVDEGEIPDVSKARISTDVPDMPTSRTAQLQRAKVRSRHLATGTTYSAAVAEESRSREILIAVDRIFTNSARLSGDAIVDFVRALSEVSWQEIQSSGQSESPRTFSLQKLVEISYYNMGRVRFEWANLWQILGEHFNQVGCHSNTHVVFFALDSLRQLSMRFMEIEELPGFKFQKDFLKPFEHVISNSTVITVKDMVLRCLVQMIKVKGSNIRSGWKTMFGVFTVAGRETNESIVNLAFDTVGQIYQTWFGVVIAQGAFPDLIVCYTEFSKNRKFQKKSLQSIEALKSTIPKMFKTPECPLSPLYGKDKDETIKEPKAPKKGATQEEQFWFPVLFAFHDVLMTGEDLEVRSRSLGYLFDTLVQYGGDFGSDFWDILWRQLLFPIFVVLKSKSEMSKVVHHEELSVWLSTTMIQALRSMISLFTHYFASLHYMLDKFLDLLALCICQESDTIARIGSNCLQQLILQNVNKFEPEHWNKIVGAFVILFERTTARELFSAVTVVGGDIMPSIQLSQDGESGDLTLSPTPLDDEKLENSLKINGLTEALEQTGASESSSNLSIPTPSTPSLSSESTTPEAPLEDYRPQSGVQQPVVVTAARRRFFNRIITKCVLQLLMIETVNELFSNDAVYERIPSPALLKLMAVLKKSFLFARKFNGEKELRMRLWREGFMKQPPNLLKQESGSAATYVSILLRMYHDEGEERRRNRADTELALIPLCVDIIKGYISLDEETQQRNIVAWRPVVVDVIEGYTTFPTEEFEKHVATFYPFAVELLSRDLRLEERVALQVMLRRIGETKLGVPPSVSSPSLASRRSSVSTLASRKLSKGGR